MSRDRMRLRVRRSDQLPQQLRHRRSKNRHIAIRDRGDGRGVAETGDEDGYVEVEGWGGGDGVGDVHEHG